MALFVVTGAAGFIGSHLVDALLAAGHNVRGLDDFSTGRVENVDPRCDMVRGDVADVRTVRRVLRGADGCFHLAAVASVARANEDWLGTHRTNLTGTVTVLDAARHHGCMPVVYASSAAVYGDLDGRAAHEDLFARPSSAYGADKLGSELHATVAWRVHGVPTLGLRFFNVYGPRQDPKSPYSGVISIFANRLAIAAPVTIYGDGGQLRDFIHVADVVRHLTGAMAALDGNPGTHVLNVCTGEGTTVLDLINILADRLGQRPQIKHAPARDGDIRRSVGDPSRAAAVLGIRAKLRLADGLGAMLAFA